MTGVYHHAQLFWDGVLWTFFFAQVVLEPQSSPISASWIAWDVRHVPLHLAVGWDGVSQMFLPELALNCDPSNLSLQSR
jgi:hypothetical protein